MKHCRGLQSQKDEELRAEGGGGTGKIEAIEERGREDQDEEEGGTGVSAAVCPGENTSRCRRRRIAAPNKEENKRTNLG